MSTPSRDQFECQRCSSRFSLGTPLARCEVCNGPLKVSGTPRFTRNDVDTREHSLWRYRTAIAAGATRRITLGEGLTPLIESKWLTNPVLFKSDHLNPSGSFKDRGVAVLLSYLAERGIDRIAEDSSGNAGASMALYAARAGITCRIFAPAKASPSKLIQSRAAGASVVTIAGTRSDVADAAMNQRGYFYAGHNWHAHFLEGTKTIAYEIWEGLDFRAPDNIVVPVGAGSTLLGCHLGFGELLASGAIDALPRLFAVQAEACAPVHAAFQAGALDCTAAITAPTIAEGIVIAAPPRGREILAALRASGGGTVAVSEDEITAAMTKLAGLGFFVEPTSAATAAGLTRLMASETIARSQKTVVMLTGSGLKAPDAWQSVLAQR